MTLLELSAQYKDSAEALRTRIRLLRDLAQQTQSGQERKDLLNRVRVLSSMWLQAHEIAVLTEHYYERNYCRNGKYIL